MNREDTYREDRRAKALDQVAEFKDDLLANEFEQYRVDELRHVAANLSLRFNYAGDEWQIRWAPADNITDYYVFRVDLRLNKSVADQLEPLWSQWAAFRQSRWYHFEPAEA